MTTGVIEHKLVITILDVNAYCVFANKMPGNPEHAVRDVQGVSDLYDKCKKKYMFYS